MNRQHLFLGTIVFLLLTSFAHNHSGAADESTEQLTKQPNILWITAEDMSPTLGCYGDDVATTPNIDQLATQSVLYRHAFATAPVCSPSRACLINGLIATSQGTHQMRSAFPIPAFMTGFPGILRKSGYYTSNNVKTDYNSANSDAIIRESWDESSATAHWQNRPPGKPFFSVFNLMTSHQSRTMAWPYDQFVKEVQSELTATEIHDVRKVVPPPYYPDTPVVRKTIARYYDCVTLMDKQVGEILRQLDDDGLAENTIVFFYSDHGSGMPRHKRVLLDTGTRIPLIIRFPSMVRHLAPGNAGSRIDRLVSFDDFGPTVLRIAGAPVPDYMKGNVFLGRDQDEPRQYVYGHRDRIDEVIDLARSVRDKQFLYIRNFMPHLGYNQPSAWPDQGEIKNEFRRLADPQRMTAVQWHFAGPTRPREELYDCDADPMNLVNLAGSKQYQSKIDELRGELFRHIRESRDLGFIPEAIAWDQTQGTTLWEMARKNSDDEQQRLVNAASAVGSGDETLFQQNLKHADAGVRYWGAVGFSSCQTISPQAIRALIDALSDPVLTVRIESAAALARHGRPDISIPVLCDALTDDSLAVVLHAARSIELLSDAMIGDKIAAATAAMQACDDRMKNADPQQELVMFIEFSTDAFLKRVGSR
ncbi:MAG: sulfatase-like hydrolase/transferase [Planctomycetales bacterium]|nr:sulfatase-like hydrolase/transferase [Planctomycetales bacterium]